MGLLGPFKCAFCGKEFRGLRWSIKIGKEVCGGCYDKLHKEFSGNKWQRMTITQIREHFAEKDRLEAQKECSFCGRRFDDSDIYKTILKDKSLICYKCTESMRLVKPVLNTVKYKNDEGYTDVSEDPVKELTIEDIPWVQKEAAEERERRTALYGDHKAVFVVDDVTRYFKEPDAHQVFGRVVLGRIDTGDTLCVKRREGVYRKVVTWIDPLEYNKKAKSLSEGHDGNLMILGDVTFIYPGDVLTVEHSKEV